MIEEEESDGLCLHCLELETRFTNLAVHGIVALLVDKGLIEEHEAEDIFESAAAELSEDSEAEPETKTHLEN